MFMILMLKDALKNSLSKDNIRINVEKYLQEGFMAEQSSQEIKSKVLLFQRYLNLIADDSSSDITIRITKENEDLSEKYVLLIVRDGVEVIFDINRISLDEILLGSVEGYQEKIEVIGDIISILMNEKYLKNYTEINENLNSDQPNDMQKVYLKNFTNNFNTWNFFENIRLPDLSNTKRMVSIIVDSLKDFQVKMEPVIQTMKIMTESISKAISSIDFEGWVKNMKEAEKRKLSRFLQYDWYFPIFLLEDLPIIFEFESASEANRTAIELLNDFKVEHGYDLNDFIPKSLKTYKELIQIDYLLNVQMYKTTVIYCLERIESRIKQMQQNENSKIQYSKLKVGKGGYDYYMNVLKEESDYLDELVSKITIDQKVHLFDRFVEGMEYKNEQGEYPLNRNLFLHGFVDDSEVNEIMAKKAILAYGFFESLFLLKYKPKEKIRRVNGKSGRAVSLADSNSCKRRGFSTI
ncbi:hypothetical protein RV04_GL001791 [Enterococcus hermanniensis]|uniref:Uncharacterized protein n=2 Tax=Enterococcus hermanniensis TaxID=249189 RepID=A0A1L8TNW3_9ENTE|nr:hypothetical protein RV04_GL001791 [Enterococcus hermanniensis]